jgi:hypothetical protein
MPTPHRTSGTASGKHGSIRIESAQDSDVAWWALCHDAATVVAERFIVGLPLIAAC